MAMIGAASNYVFWMCSIRSEAPVCDSLWLCLAGVKRPQLTEIDSTITHHVPTNDSQSWAQIMTNIHLTKKDEE